MSELDDNKYPRFVRGRWVSSPLNHLAMYADNSEPYVAVPRELLLSASRFRECSARKTFVADEDGPITAVEAVCRRGQGHDDAGNAEHFRAHSNGYFSWPPAIGDVA